MQHDDIRTSDGPVTITFIGHGTLMLQWKKLTIHVDPWSKLTDYKSLPKADLILITHGHKDHFDSAAIQAIATPSTQFVTNGAVHDQLKQGTALANGDTITIDGIGIEAVPAYNTTEGRDKFHPKGRDNGYILTIAGTRIYIAGDTEDTPEMKALKNIDVTFLPMNQPYTMVPAQVAAAAKAFRPKILYPYHTGETDVAQLTNLMKGEKGIELRLRSMK